MALAETTAPIVGDLGLGYYQGITPAFNTPGDVTIGMWLRPQTTPTTGAGRVGAYPLQRDNHPASVLGFFCFVGNQNAPSPLLRRAMIFERQNAAISFFIWQSADNVYAVDAWQFFAWVMTSAGATMKMYVGGITGRVAEVSGYNLQNPNGATAPWRNDSAVPTQMVQDFGLATPTGHGPMLVVPATMTAAQLDAWRWSPRLLPSAKGFWQPGRGGVGTQVDDSGNGGALAVVTQAPAVVTAYIPGPFLPTSARAAVGGM